jgi:hypothetical protein
VVISPSMQSFQTLTTSASQENFPVQAFGHAMLHIQQPPRVVSNFMNCYQRLILENDIFNESLSTRKKEHDTLFLYLFNKSMNTWIDLE